LNTTRHTKHWLVVSILLLTCALAVLAVCSWYSLKLRAHQGQVTGLALTLTRIASLTAETPASATGALPAELLQSDQLAQLIATGDTQAAAIEQASPGFPLNRVASQYPQVVMHWQSVRREFGRLNSQLLQPSAGSSRDLTGIAVVQQSFDKLFDAIINESLSRPLLKTASTLRADLNSLQFVAANNTAASATLQPLPLQPLIEKVKRSAAQLQSTAMPDNGPSLLGYTTSGQLKDFLTAVESLTVAAPAAALSAPQSTGDLAEVSATALSYIQNALRFVDAELHRSRRNLLAALSLACLGVLFITALTWSYRRASCSAQQNTRLTLNALVDDLTHIADGKLAPGSELLQIDQANQPIAELVDYTKSMVQGLVSVSRGVAHKTTELAAMQQASVEELAGNTEANARQTTEQLDALNTALSSLRQRIEVSTASSESNNESLQSTGIHSVLQESVGATAASLAGLSAQLDMGAGRIERALSVTDALKGVIGKMETASQQSNLQALNASIKNAGYHDNDADTDVFIQSSQRVSRQLQTECITAMQQALEVRADLEACAASLRECLSLLEQSAGHSLLATQSLRKLPSPSAATNIDTTAMVSDVAAISDIAGYLNNHYQAMTADENLLLLKGHALELQLMAAKLDESMLRFELSELPDDER
jgi:hypothetical protein